MKKSFARMDTTMFLIQLNHSGRIMNVSLILTFLISGSLIFSCGYERKGSDSNIRSRADSNKEGNAIRIIFPYKYNGVWVFDDSSNHLTKEPFVNGIPEMIDSLVADIADADNGFAMYFSENKMPGTTITLNWIKEDFNGNWYKAEEYNMEGWLCPALFKYYKSAPKTLYVRAEKKN